MQTRRYETLFIVHPDLGEPGAKEITARIQKLLEEQGGVIGQIQEWGMRELAYPIEKQHRGTYVFFEYRATPKAVTEIERQMKIMDAVIRFQSVRQDENAPPTPDRTARRVDEDVAPTRDTDTDSEPDAEGAGEEMPS